MLSLTHLKSRSLLFVIINLIVATLGFARSFSFIRFFEFKELGVITIITTTAMLISFFQLGIINGGFRIIASNSDFRVKTNNVVFSYFLVLSIIVLIIGLCLAGIIGQFNFIYIISALVLGLLSLTVNWLSNNLIGMGALASFNYANLLSASCGVILLFTIPYLGIIGAILSLISQPLCFIVVVFIKEKETIPSKIDIDFSYVKSILSYGFIPFLSGMFFLCYTQIERWIINLYLGPEYLGKLYLFFLIVTIWSLMPASINNLFFPKCVKYFSEKKQIEFQVAFRNNLLVLLIYCILGSLLILVLFPYLVSIIFPKHAPYVGLVLWAIPGLVLKVLADIPTLYLNTVVKLNSILWSDIIGLVVYFVTILVLINSNLKLENIIIGFNIYFAVKFLILTLSYFIVKNRNHKFLFH